MDTKNIKITVAGDVCVNILKWNTSFHGTSTLEWKSYPNVHQKYIYGEALLLAQMVEQATNLKVKTHTREEISNCVKNNTLLSNVELERFPKVIGSKRNASRKKESYRVNQYLGFSGPSKGIPKIFPIQEDDIYSDMVILDDENNGYSLSEKDWPKSILSTTQKPMIIYKTNHLNVNNPMWKVIEENHLENTIVVINADDLRAKGVNISKGLSWEKTALDFVWQMNNNPTLSFLAKSRYLIVPLGLEGAILYKNDGKESKSHLFFLTTDFEGEYVKNNKGQMFGLTSCFVAGLASSLVDSFYGENIQECLEEGIRQGIVSSIKYFANGFGENLDYEEFPKALVFFEKEEDFIYKEHVQDVEIRNSLNPNCRSCWYIIKDKSSANLEGIAYDIVKYGEKSALRFIPIAQFGNLKAVDRTEIESYRSIQNLMYEYISTQKTPRPLSIAVFGTPGSGKSFGVTEVASTVAPGLIEKIDFNLSQFQSISELVSAFHKVRDISLLGKLPLVFFDEFDSDFHGRLGWLKYFLAPMQDGVFREGDTIHPIGKAIFVFAGGTSSTFQDFRGELLEDKEEFEAFSKNFKVRKDLILLADYEAM